MKKRIHDPGLSIVLPIRFFLRLVGESIPGMREYHVSAFHGTPTWLRELDPSAGDRHVGPPGRAARLPRLKFLRTPA